MPVVESEMRQVFSAEDRTTRAFRSLQNNARRTERAWKRLKFGIAGVLLALGGRGFGQGIRNVARLASEIDNASRKTGLAVERYQEYSALAEQAGINTRQFDTSLQRLTRRIGEAAKGEGELLKVVREYGLQIRDDKGAIRDTESVLKDLADIISRVESEQEQLRITTKAFDVEGADLVNVLREGGDALEQNARTAGRFNTITTEQIDQVKTLTAEFGEWGDVLKSFAVGALADVTAGVKELSDELQNLVAPTKEGPPPLVNELLEQRAELIAEIQKTGAAINRYVNTRNQGPSGAQIAEFTRLQLELQDLERQIVSAQFRQRGGPPPAPRVFTPRAQTGPGQFIPGSPGIYNEGLGAGETGPPFEGVRRAAKETERQVEQTFLRVNVFAQRAAQNMQDTWSDLFFDPFNASIDDLGRRITDTFRRLIADLASQKFLTALFQPFAGSAGLLGDFSRQALGGLGQSIYVDARGADPASAARLEAAAIGIAGEQRDGFRRGQGG